MALIGNNSLLTRLPVRQMGGTIVSGFTSQFSPSGSLRNRYGTFVNYAATPNGYLSPIAWVLPMTAGGMSTTNQVELTVAKTSAVLVNAQYITGSSTITVAKFDANLGQIFAALCSGAITVAQATSDLTALVAASGASSITFTLVDAILGGKFSMEGSSAIVITPAGLLTATAFMEASAGGATPLSPEGLAAAVWGALASDFNDVGTMGEKLNDAGSASNPWTEVIEAGYTAAEILKLIAAYAVGKTVIVDNGGGNADVTFKGIDGLTNRIVAEVQDSERIGVVLDGI